MSGSTNDLKKPEQKPAVPVKPIGALDGIQDGVLLTGWAWNEVSPARLARIAIGVDGDRVFNMAPQDFRADLVASGIGHGCYAFQWRIPDVYRDGRPHEFRVVHLDLRRELPGSPLTATLSAATPEAAVAEEIPAFVNADLSIWPNGIQGRHTSRLQEIAPGLLVASEEAAGAWRFMLREPRRRRDNGTGNYGVWLEFEQTALWRLHHRIAPAAAARLRAGASLSLEIALAEAVEAMVQRPVEILLSRQGKDGPEAVRRLLRGRVFRQPTLLPFRIELTAEEEKLASARSLFLTIACEKTRSLYFHPAQIVTPTEAAPSGILGFEDGRLDGVLEECRRLARVNRKLPALHQLLAEPEEKEAVAAPRRAGSAAMAETAYPFTQVVVPVFNGDVVVLDCLRSLREATTTPFQVLVLNDGSRKHTTRLLREFVATDPRFVLYDRNTNKGYTKSINEGIKLTCAEWIVILNSDTVVSNGWLRKLHDAAASRPDVGMAGALSNAASWQSIPRTKEPDGSWSKNDFIVPEMLPAISAMLDQHSERAYPAVPMLNGFCTLITREVFRRCGLFDEDAFPIGYGEETDLCLRAAKAGFALVVADDCFVYHRKSVSFGSKGRKPLSKAGSLELTNKHSDVSIPDLERDMQGEPTLVRLRARLADMRAQVEKWHG